MSSGQSIHEFRNKYVSQKIPTAIIIGVKGSQKIGGWRLRSEDAFYDDLILDLLSWPTMKNIAPNKSQILNYKKLSLKKKKLFFILFFYPPQE